ncbi:MAG: hypothetical protein R3D55_00825 [Chloroflexota bacterium]
MSGKPGRRINRKRLFYSITPLLLMLVALVVLNVVTPKTEPPPQNEAANTAVSPQPVANASTPTRSPILQATILPSPTPTSTPLPDPPAEATITLFGPPAESSLPVNGRITFYWTYSEPLLPGQAMVLTVRQNDLAVAASSLTAPNFGSGYQVSLDFGELTEGGTAVWQVHLQWQNIAEPLLQSEPRSLVLLPG